MPNINADIGNKWIDCIKTLYPEITFDSELEPEYQQINTSIEYGQIISSIETKANTSLEIVIDLKCIDDKDWEDVEKRILTNTILRSDFEKGLITQYFFDELDKKYSILPHDKNSLKINYDNITKPFLGVVLNELKEEINNNPTLLLILKGFDYESLKEKITCTGKNRSGYLKYDFSSLSRINANELTEDDLYLPELRICDLFLNMPEAPVFFGKNDFKTKLTEIYERFAEEFKGIFSNSSFTAVRNTDFFCFEEDGTLKFFITPANNFSFYLKSKGSLFRCINQTLNVPVMNHETRKVEFVPQEGFILSSDIIFDYFCGVSHLVDKNITTPSFQFLNDLILVSTKFIEELYFYPQTKQLTPEAFKIVYEPLFKNAQALNLFDKLKNSFTPIFAFNPSTQEMYSDDFVEKIFFYCIDYLVYKFIFLKGAKFKNDKIAAYFAKNVPFKSYRGEKNLEAAMSDWLNILRLDSYKYVPVLRIENNSEDTFVLYIDVQNNLNSKVEPLSSLFECDETFGVSSELVKDEIAKQIIFASEFLPVLKDIFVGEGKYTPVLDLNDILIILTKVSSLLKNAGINIVLPKDLKNIIIPKASVSARIKKSKEDVAKQIFSVNSSSVISINDIMDFSYEIAIGDEKISKEEFEQLVKDTDGIVKYKDKYIMISPEEAKKLLEKLEAKNGGFTSKMDLLHATLTGSMGDFEFSYDEILKNILDEITRVDEVDLPQNLTATLRPYQEKGYKWLYSNTVKGFGSCIADDMGLGKTVQVLTLILKMKDEQRVKTPVLVVCPTTLVGNWFKECDMFAPSLNVNIYHGQERKIDTGADVVITTYSILRIDKELLKDIHWSMVIIDEAQNIKNPDTVQTMSVKALKTNTCIAVTGTPVENRLTELWSIFDFINKGYLSTVGDFQKNYSIPVEKQKEADKAEKLKKATSPFILRRLKTDKNIITDLPEKLVLDDYCYLTKEQAALYEKVLESSMKVISTTDGINRRGNIFKLITSLKQICNHPVHYQKMGTPNRMDSGKTDKLLSILESVVDNGEKALVFTQYKQMGDILTQVLDRELNQNALFFHGALSREKREETIDQFQNNDKNKIMILSLKAGGTGLNLTAATNVIHYDLWWNPAVEEQATDRTYRIGQTENVMVHRLITLGTFEEKIDEMIKSKKELANMAVFTGEKMLSELSNAELFEIFNLGKQSSI